jgi:hypothetical protein
MKIKTIKKMVFLPLLALLGACASDEVQPVNPEVVQKLQAIDRTQKAVLVIYRNDDSQGRGVHPTVTMNGKDLVDTGNGETFVAGIDPGHYIFEMDNKKSGTDVTVKAGDEIYLRVDIVQGVWRPSGRMTQVTPQQGAYEAQRMDLVSPRSIDMPEYR